MKVLKSGDLAFLDTFSGLIPCRVESIKGAAGGPSTAQKIEVKLTADRGAYKCGEVIETNGTSVVPRSSVYTNNGRFRITTNWQVQPD